MAWDDSDSDSDPSSPAPAPPLSSSKENTSKGHRREEIDDGRGADWSEGPEGDQGQGSWTPGGYVTPIPRPPIILSTTPTILRSGLDRPGRPGPSTAGVGTRAGAGAGEGEGGEERSRAERVRAYQLARSVHPI